MLNAHGSRVRFRNSPHCGFALWCYCFKVQSVWVLHVPLRPSKIRYLFSPETAAIETDIAQRITLDGLKLGSSADTARPGASPPTENSTLQQPSPAELDARRFRIDQSVSHWANYAKRPWIEDQNGGYEQTAFFITHFFSLQCHNGTSSSLLPRVFRLHQKLYINISHCTLDGCLLPLHFLWTCC
jgi:hypothetical protein